MLIQGSLFKDYYISDSVLTDLKQQLWAIPEIVSIEVDSDCDELDGEFTIMAFVFTSTEDFRFNSIQEEIVAIVKPINAILNTDIYVLQDWV